MSGAADRAAAMCWSRTSAPACSPRWASATRGSKALKPDLVVCNISGFGTTGPYRDRPSFDFIAQAMSGFMA